MKHNLMKHMKTCSMYAYHRWQMICSRMSMTPWCSAKALHQWHRYARASCSIRARAVNYAAYQPSCSSWLPLMHKCTLWSFQNIEQEKIIYLSPKPNGMQPNAHGIGMPRLGAPSGKVSCQLCCLSPTLPPLWLPSAGHRLQWALTEHTKIRTSFWIFVFICNFWRNT